MYYNDKTIVYFDDAFRKANETGINPFSQTIHYGYGVFEGIRAYKTADGPKIFKAREHYLRFIHSCRLMHIPYNYSVEDLIHISYELLKQNELENAYIRPVMIGDPNMSLTKAEGSRLFMAAWDWKYFADDLLRLHISNVCRPHPGSVKVEAKTCGHYVNSILATTEAKLKGFDEALMLDHEGYLAEGPGANLFFERNGRLYAPARGRILPGITRSTVIDLCKNLHIPIESGRYKPAHLFEADSAFYCGTGVEIAGIKSVDHYEFPKPWKEAIGKEIQDIYYKLVREEVIQEAGMII